MKREGQDLVVVVEVATGDSGATIESASGVGSVLHSLKEIVSIVMGLALTNSILALITNDHYISVVSLSALPLASVLFTLVLVVNIVRFYHGNMRHMDALYGESALKAAVTSTHGSLGNLGLDFIVVFVQSIIFAVLSFYAAHRPDFLLLFLFLLTFDLLWNIATQQEASEARDVAHQRGWMLNNVVAVLIVIILYMVYQNHHDFLWLDIAVGVIGMNTIVDFYISWDFYFPPLKRTPAQ